MKLSISGAPYQCKVHFAPIDVYTRATSSLAFQRRPIAQELRVISPARTPPESRSEIKNWERLLKLPDYNQLTNSRFSTKPVDTLAKNWKEYQGVTDWDGLLDPLDDNLRHEILRYGQFVEACYRSFDFDPSSPSYATCLFPKAKLLDQSGIPETGYRLTRNLQATSGIKLPNWLQKSPKWVQTQSSWIGYVAICHDKEEIKRLGRRDIVISYRGTATCLEWLENLRATLTRLPSDGYAAAGDWIPMVERGFLSLYTSGIHSLQKTVRTEIARLLRSYGDEPLSLTITGHSLGAALAVLTAYDIKSTFNRVPMVTVVSFGGPRVGNRRFREKLEEQGTKVLRIVNSDDVVTKVPGFVLDAASDDMVDDNNNNNNNNNNDNANATNVAALPGWVQRRVEDTRWVYADVGRELRLRSRDSPYLSGVNVATCHELKTYLHLVGGFVSSTCPFRNAAERSSFFSA